jgi:hypothetical protein
MHDGVALDAIMRAELHGPVTSDIKPGSNIGTRLQQRQHIRQRIHAVLDDREDNPDSSA